MSARRKRGIGGSDVFNLYDGSDVHLCRIQRSFIRCVPAHPKSHLHVRCQRLLPVFFDLVSIFQMENLSHGGPLPSNSSMASNFLTIKPFWPPACWSRAGFPYANISTRKARRSRSGRAWPRAKSCCRNSGASDEGPSSHRLKGRYAVFFDAYGRNGFFQEEFKETFAQHGLSYAIFIPRTSSS